MAVLHPHQPGLCSLILDQKQWKIYKMKGQGTDKICSLYRGFVILRFFSVYFAVTGVRNIISYTEDFINVCYIIPMISKNQL